jgi:hypothetical protein
VASVPLNLSFALITTIGSPIRLTLRSEVLALESNVPRIVSIVRSIAESPISAHVTSPAGTTMGCAAMDCTSDLRVGFAVWKYGSGLDGSQGSGV